jgi:tetratricopeptide (TPR) repeat protein
VFILGVSVGFYMSHTPIVFASSPYTQTELQSAERGNESQIRALRDEEIRQLRIALGRRLPTNRRADLYFRLAEIDLEAYRAEFLLEGRVHESRLAKGIQDPLIAREHSRPFLSHGIQACLEVLNYKIPFDKLDRIYYFLGFYYGELDQAKEGIPYYRKLVQEFPESPLAGIALKEVGEFEYRHADYRNAIQHLEVALTKVKPDLGPGILHKLAWCYYRTKQFDRAISTMKDVISRCDGDKERYLPLKEESLRDMATLLTEQGHVEEAIRYFQAESGDQALYPKLLEKLGREYEHNAELGKSEKVYETLIQMSPESEASLKALLKLVELDLRTKQYARIIQRVKEFHFPKAQGTEVQNALQNLRVSIRKVAVDHHQLYRNHKKPTDLEIAQEFYQAYLNYFLIQEDSHHEAPEIEMYLAEVNHDLGRHQQAVDLYRKVIASKDPRFAQKAGALWAGGLADLMKKAPARTGADDLSELEKEFVAASDELRTTQGDTPEAHENALRVAQVMAGYKVSRPESVRRLQEIIHHWPKSPQAGVAARLWIQLYLDHPHEETLPDHLPAVLQAIRSNSELLMGDHAHHQGKLQALLDELSVKEKVETISQQEKSQDFQGAGHGYEEFAASSHDREVFEKSMTNAVSSYLKAAKGEEPTSEHPGSKVALLRVIETWSHRYPGSPKAMEPLRSIATHALIVGDFDFSAQIFKKLGIEFLEPQSLDTAARLYQAISDTSHAQSLWSQYLTQIKDAPRRAEIELELARSQEKSGLDSEASHSYRACAAGQDYVQAECQARLADLYLKSQDITKAKELYSTLAGLKGATGKKGAKGSHSKATGHSLSPFVGYARYQLADLMEKEAAFEPMKFPEAQLKRGLNQRLDFLGPLSNAYQSAVEVGGPWGIAALHRLALWAKNFADEVDEIEAPATLQGAALERFKKQILSVSQPLREKAKVTWTDAFSKAATLKIFSPVLPEVGDALADFKAGAPAMAKGRAQGSRGPLVLAGLPAQGGTEGAQVALSRVREVLLKNAKDSSAWTDYGNLLWGEGKPLLARLAYQRALSLKPNSPAPLNNLAVVKLRSEGEEDWVAAAEAAGYLEAALHADDFFNPAKMNLASLLNYYRLFQKSKSLWDQIRIRNAGPESDLGLAVALQGLGNTSAAEGLFKKVEDAGHPQHPFIQVYHRAARESVKGRDGAETCIDLLRGIMDRNHEQSEEGVFGFEKSAVSHLMRTCELWKKKN